MKKKSIGALTIAFTAMMAAMVYVVTLFRFPLLGSKVHFANAVCLLAGLLLGPVTGGLSAGLGSALYDVLFGGYDFLNAAITRDPLGVSFNTLPNIFDLQSRHIKSGLTVIGLDVKKNIEENFSDKATLDDLIFILENGKISEVAVEKIGISYNQNDDAINHFLQWVLENGTKYNHEYGLLNLDNKLTQEQISKVKTTLTAQK